MAAKLTRLTHKIAIQLQIVAKNYTVPSSRFRWPVPELLDTPSYALFFPLSVLTRLHVGGSGFDFLERQGFFVFATASRPALGPTWPLIQWESWVLFSWVKRPEV
jgi:hypothetical protein